MAVYNVSDNLYEYLKRCPKTHKKYQGYYTITKWADIDEKKIVKEFSDFIADYSSLSQTKYRNNLVNETKDKIGDINHKNNTLKQITKGIDDYKGYDDIVFMLENENTHWNNFYKGREKKPFSQRMSFLLTDNYISSFENTDKKYMVIFPKNEIEPKIQFDKKKVVIQDKSVEMGQEQIALYRLFYNHNKDGLTSNDIKEKYLDELSGILTKSYRESKSFPLEEKKNPYRRITNLINEINSKLIKNGILSIFCIKLKREKVRGNGYNIAIYEINRKSIS